MTDKEAIRDHWVEALSGWEHAYRTTPSRVKRIATSHPYPKIIRTCGLSAGSRVLNAGCGGGQYALAFGIRGMPVVCLDYSKRMLATCEGNARRVREKLFEHLDIRIVEGDLFRIPMEDGHFDFTFNAGVLEHFRREDERVAAIREMKRVTKRGGYVGIMIPNNLHPFYAYWMKKGLEWIQEDSPLREERISKEMLASEMKSAGLGKIWVDGFDTYASLAKYPSTPIRRFCAKALKALFPEPPLAWRLRWGVDLVAVGSV